MACILTSFTTPAIKATVSPISVKIDVRPETLNVDAKLQPKASVAIEPVLIDSEVESKLLNVDVKAETLTVTVKPYEPEPEPGKISVTVTKMYADWTPHYTFETQKVTTSAILGRSTVSLFCPIDLIKSCFGSGHWIEYRPWLENEAWKHSIPK